MNNTEMSQEQIESKYTLTILMCVIFGSLGIHRFINGKIGSGVAMLLTCGGCGIWMIIDFVNIITGTFRNSNDILIATQNKGSVVNIISIIIMCLKLLAIVVYFMSYIVLINTLIDAL